MRCSLWPGVPVPVTWHSDQWIRNMANTNPGPAVTGSANSMLAAVPVNTQTNSNPVETNALRVLAVGRALNVNTTGDIGTLPVINSSRWNVQAVVYSNMGNNAGTSVALGVYPG